MLQQDQVEQLATPSPANVWVAATHGFSAFGTLGPSCATCQPSAIDRDDRSGHIIGQVGSKELDDLGTILDGSEPTKGNQLSSIAVALNAAGNDRRHDPRGRDDAGSDAVDGNAERPEILGRDTACNER